MTKRRNGSPYKKAGQAPVAMVAIERYGDQYRYLRYENGKLTDKAESPEPISAEHVELLRSNPSAILGDDEADATA